MKKCSCCGIEKPDSDFNKNNTRKDGLQGYCRECSVKKLKEYRTKRKASGESYKPRYYGATAEYLRKKSKEKNQERNEFLNSLKTPCVKCGESRPWVIQFHHIDPSTKEFSIATRKLYKEERLVKEISKCVCLCSNCHNEFHYFYGYNPEKPADALERYLNE